MKYEELREKFIKLKKEELEYINNISNESNKRKFSEEERLDVYRKIHYYVKELNNLIKEIRKIVMGNKLYKENNGILVEFDIDKDYLSTINHKGSREMTLRCLGIDPETHKFKLAYNFDGYYPIDSNSILSGNLLFDNCPYIFTGIFEKDEEDYFIYENELGIYYNLLSMFTDEEKIAKSQIPDFENNRIIIKLESRVLPDEVKTIFKEALLNKNNKTIQDCVNETKERMHELSYNRNPKTKEKVLLNKMNELYSKVKGELIKNGTISNGSFIELLKETYKLPDNRIVDKERIIKNGGKDGVIIIPILKLKNGCSNNGREFIITVQNRINNKLIAEFPSGYIEDGESPIEAAKRELMEETGYTTEGVFLLDEAYISPGIDNATNYIVVAYNCEKTNEPKTDGTELVTYGIFKEQELKYIVDNNIMNGAMNKLAYYDYINNVDGSGYDIREYYMVYDELSKKKKINSLEKWR